MSVYFEYPEQEPTPNQVKELQDALNAMTSDPAWKHKIIVLPPSGPNPLVTLLCEVGRVRLRCPCGWEWDVHKGPGTTEFQFEYLRTLAKHECLESEEEK